MCCVFLERYKKCTLKIECFGGNSMSYKNDREEMNEEMKLRKNQVMLAIKITFLGFAVALVALAVMFAINIFNGGLFASDKDETPPSISARAGTTVIGYLGESPTYKKYVTVTDDKDEEPVLAVNSKNVDINKEGSYTVLYQAKDKSGNKSSVFKLTYVVKSKEYSKDKLMGMIAEKVKEVGITDGMSKQKKVEKIFNYVHNLFRYSDDSNIPNIDRSKWKSDWIEEAVRTINDEAGDCYSYYSLSKAFFEYYNIENIGIMRDPKSSLDGTHYWSIVNIGENGEDKWYYYDATRLAGTFKDADNACLITQDTLNSHKTSKGATDFYLMTKAPAYLDFSSAGGINSLPAMAKEKIN